MTDQPGFAALETTIATALWSPMRQQVWGGYVTKEEVSEVARAVCEAITTQSEIRPAARLVYGDDDGSVPTVWGLWFPLAERGEKEEND